MLESASNKAIRHVWTQFRNRTAQEELQRMGPAGMDWPDRTRETLETILPRLPELAKRLSADVPEALNASARLHELLKKGHEFTELAREQGAEFEAWIKELDRISERAQTVVGHLESQQVSSAIQRYIISHEGLGDLVIRNGGSIYPDLILKDRNYSKLPRQTKKKLIDGPCLRGANPSNVPDGCEIKTNQGTRVRVDAHGAHPGLHLCITWDFAKSNVLINGVWVAYVRIADHRESGRNVKVTTVKYSFGHELFESLL